MDILILVLLPQFNGVSRKKSKEIIVFFNDISTPLFNDSIIRLLKTTYHELYHAIDDTREKETQITYNDFASDCDRFIINHSPLDQLKYILTPNGHDSFMFEILANIHGINKTEQYILRILKRYFDVENLNNTETINYIVKEAIRRYKEIINYSTI